MIASVLKRSNISESLPCGVWGWVLGIRCWKECEKNEILEPSIITRLRYYYDKDGIRNNIFHNRKENVNIQISEIDELKQIIKYLANLYDENSEYIDNYPCELIEKV